MTIQQAHYPGANPAPGNPCLLPYGAHDLPPLKPRIVLSDRGLILKARTRQLVRACGGLTEAGRITGYRKSMVSYWQATSDKRFASIRDIDRLQRHAGVDFFGDVLAEAVRGTSSPHRPADRATRYRQIVAASHEVDRVFLDRASLSATNNAIDDLIYALQAARLDSMMGAGS